MEFDFDTINSIFFTARELERKCMVSSFGTVVANDYFELATYQALRLKSKLVFILLGDSEHYYGLAARHKDIIDGYIAISGEIRDKLLAILPESRHKDVHLVYFPTPNAVSTTTISSSGCLRF